MFVAVFSSITNSLGRGAALGSLFCGGESLFAKKKDILAQIYSTWRPTKKYRLEEEREREVVMHHDFAY